MLRNITFFTPLIWGIIFATSVIQVSGDETEFNLQQVSPSVLNVSITTGDIVTFSAMTNEGEFTRLSLPNFHLSRDVGEPELPEIHNLIEIPQDALPYIEIVSSNYRDYSLIDLGIENLIYPAQPSLSKSQNPDDIPFAINSNVYLKNTLLKKELVSVDIKGQLRAIRIANLNIRLVDYNPTEGIIRVYTNLEINIHMNGADYAKTEEIKETYYSPYFEAVYNQIPNYDSSIRTDDMIGDPVTYVIVANSSFEGYLDEFIEWKTQKGYHIIVGYTGDIGSSALAIKNYIHNLYNNPEDGVMPPSFVLLVGDTAQLPASYSSGGHVSDNDYGDVSGDMMPEILYGRFSAQTPMHLQSQIDKTLEYEKYEMADPSFLGEVVMISGVDASYAPTYGNGQINYGTDYYFNNDHGIYSNTYLYPLSGSSGSQIKSDVSSGAAYVNYTAHGYEQGWADPSFTNSDVNNLTNNGKYPLMVGNCCLTNAFDTGECFGEALLRAQNKGAVGYIGGSDVTYWNEDYWWGVGNGNITSNPSYSSTGPGAYDCTFNDNNEENWAVVNSTLMVAGNLGVVEANGMVDYYWEIYHLMGDPSLSTYFGVPSENNLTHTEFLPVGSTSINISGEPYTYVGITQNGNILGSGQINQFGTIELTLSNANIPGTAQIVGTCQNHQPYFGEILIASPEGPYVMVESTSFTSGSGDDSDIIQFGETVSLSVNLENVGNDDATGVEINLSSDDPYINITMGSITVFSLPSDNSYNTEGFEFEVSANIPNEYDFEISCSISANGEMWESVLNFTAYAPVIEVDAVIGSLDPGVSANLEVNLLNTGGADIHSPMVSVIGDSYVTVNSSSFTNAYFWDNGDQINNEEVLSLSVSVSPSTPIGHIAEFTVTVNSNQPPTTDYEENVTFTIPVGQVIANFEAGLGSLDWNLSCSGLGCANWDVDNSESYTGSSSAQSGNIGNSQSSDMSITLDITADGEIDFYYRVSAEYSSSGSYFYDGLEFYIDNTLKGQYQSTTGGGSPWTQVSYDVTEGEHTFRWSYVKDGAGGSTDCDNTDCDDAAWVDDITFPPAYIESDGVLGDLNGDGTINILDVIIMVNIILGVEPESALADVNGDGVVNILDIVQEINLILDP